MMDLHFIPEDKPSYKVIGARGTPNVENNSFMIQLRCQKQTTTDLEDEDLYLVFCSKSEARNLFEHCLSSAQFPSLDKRTSL